MVTKETSRIPSKPILNPSSEIHRTKRIISCLISATGNRPSSYRRNSSRGWSVSRRNPWVAREQSNNLTLFTTTICSPSYTGCRRIRGITFYKLSFLFFLKLKQKLGQNPGKLRLLVQNNKSWSILLQIFLLVKFSTFKILHQQFSSIHFHSIDIFQRCSTNIVHIYIYIKHRVCIRVGFLTHVAARRRRRDTRRMPWGGRRARHGRRAHVSRFSSSVLRGREQTTK